MANVLGLEGGGTRTSVLLAGSNDEVIESFSAGPANLRLMGSGDLSYHLMAISRRLPCLPDAIGMGLAGARVEADFDRIITASARVWPGVPCAPSNDLVTALEATDWDESCDAQVLVLSGTGSCQMGRDRSGREVRMGGRGHVLGDRAGGYQIGMMALRELIAEYDSSNQWPQLGAEILARLQFNEPEDLIDWSLEASKTEIASLAGAVFEAAEHRGDDRIVNRVYNEAATTLAGDAITCVNRLSPDSPARVQFVFNGSVLLKNERFLERVIEQIEAARPGSVFTPLDRPSVWGAVAMAKRLVKESSTAGFPVDAVEPVICPDTLPQIWKPLTSSPTEQRHPDSTRFSELEIADGIELMLQDAETIPGSIRAAKDSIEWTVNRVVDAFARGGRLIYTGAGTSGRLGVLDASECPPTFRANPEQVQGVIAGGRKALWSAVEGAEDDSAAGRAAAIHRNVGSDDVVIGISASGHAPFIWGCLHEASLRGATTVLLTCHPGYLDHPLPDRVIAADTGPEILTGSTRLKAGTATKMILNLITTLAMTHSGKVIGNLMIDLNPSNIKLRARAVGIVSAITGCDAETAKHELEETGWIVREACESLSGKCEGGLDFNGESEKSGDRGGRRSAPD